MPASNMEENMTEEELFEWFQNAVQTGAFDNVGGNATENPSAAAKAGGGSSNKSSSNSGSGNKKKKKGKKQW